LCTGFSPVLAINLEFIRGIPFRSHRLAVQVRCRTVSLDLRSISFERIQALEYYSRRAIAMASLPPILE
jgi:hypothetical protein